jgi:hypothetical protein
LLGRAMRAEHIIDPQGRSVRAKHAARVVLDGEQITVWDDIRTAAHEHMERSFRQRRQLILGECRQLKVDVDSYNENRMPDRPVQMILDFTLDLAEQEWTCPGFVDTWVKPPMLPGGTAARTSWD